MKKLITTLISLIFTLNVASQHEIIISEEKVFKQSFKSRGATKYTSFDVASRAFIDV